MNRIEELRSTLDRHAADVLDHDLGGRVGSVHQRVRVVRRRRRAAVAGAAALTVATVAGVALLPQRAGQDVPAPATVAGLPVPASMTSLGYTYDFADGVDGAGTATVALQASNRPRLVSWGTQGSDDAVELTEGPSVTRYDVPDFSDFVWVGPGEETTLTVTGAGQVGLAVYDLTDAQPDGVTGGGVTYRQTLGDRQLLGAVIGEPGETEVTVSVAHTGGPISYRHFCAHGPKNATLHVDDGSGDVASPYRCGDDLPFDPAHATSYQFDAAPGDVTVRLWLTDGEDGPRIDSDEVVLGLGVYDGGETTQLSGFEVPQVFEYDGHLWQPYSYAASAPGDRVLEVGGGDGAPLRPVLALGYYAAQGATVVMEHSATGEGARMAGVSEGGNALIGFLSRPTDSASIKVLGDVPEDARLLVVRFERAD